MFMKPSNRMKLAGHRMCRKLHWILLILLGLNFLTEKQEVMEYLQLVRNAVNGYMIVGTFSPEGPTKCSGLSIKQYSDEELTAMFMDGFEKIKCVNVDHVTPFKTAQHFTFCSFKYKAA